jgi:hypothetical protein
MNFLPENMFVVSATAGAVTTNGGITCDNISLKNAQMVYILVHANTAVGHATAYTPLVGTSVATCATALPAVAPIWYGITTTSSTALTKQTDAVAYTMGGAVTGDTHIIFKIDPASVGTNDCLGMTVGNSGQATNFVSIQYLIVPRYASKMSTMSATEYIVD